MTKNKKEPHYISGIQIYNARLQELLHLLFLLSQYYLNRAMREEVRKL